MTATIKNLFTRTQCILLASLLALVFLCAPSTQAATSNIDLSITPSDSSIEWMGEKGVTYSFYVDGSKTETKLKEGESLFAILGMKRGTFTLPPGAHTVTAVGKDAKGVVVSRSASTAFFAGFEVPKPKVGIPTGESSSRNIYPFMAKAVSSTQIDLTFNCVVPNADHNCKIYQDGKLIKTFDVKTKDYGRYTTYSVKNLMPNTKYAFTVVEYAKKGSLPDKPRVNTYTYTPTLTLKTPSTADVVPPTTSSVKVISPNGGETYKTGGTVTVKWNTGDTTKIKNVRISLLYKENDPSDTRLFEGTVVESVPNTGSYTWKIGERYARGMQKGEFSIGVGKAETNYTAVDYSDNPFTINPGTKQAKLTVTNPKKGQIVKHNDEMLITWNVERDAGVRADLFRTSDEGFMRNLDVRGAGAKGGLIAKLPQDIPAKDDYYIRVIQGAVNEEIGYSELFSIVGTETCQAIGCTPTNGKLNFKKFLTSSSTLVSDTKDKNQSYGKIDMSFEVAVTDGDVWVKEMNARHVHPVAPQNDTAVLFEVLNGGVSTRGSNNGVGSSPKYEIKGAEKVSGSNGEKFFKLVKGNTYTVTFSIVSLVPTLAGDYSVRIVSMGYNDTPATPDTRVTPTNSKEYISKSIFIPRGTETCQAIGCTEKLTLKSSNDDPDAMTIVLDSKFPKDEEIFLFDLSAEESGSDITLSQIGVTVAVGGVSSLNEIMDSFRLEGINGKSFTPNAYSSTGRTAKLIFSEVKGEKIPKGGKVTVAVLGQFKAMTTIPAGTVISASLLPSDVSAKGPKGAVSVGGSAQNGEKHTLALAGLQLGGVIDGTGSSDSTQVVSGVSTDLNYGTMFLEYEITPFGDDMFVKANSASRGSSKTAGVSYVIEDANGNIIPTGTSSVSYDIEGADKENGYFHLEEGESYTMIVTVNSYNPIPTGTYRLQVLSVGSSPVAGGVVTQNVPSDLSDYESDDVMIQSGNSSTPVTPVGDTIAPTTPTNFRVTASTTTSVTLSWNASTDVWGVKGYNIYRDISTTPRNTTLITTTNFTDTGLAQGTGYKYAVEAVDVAGNKSVKATVSTNTPTPVTAIIPQVIPTCTLTANKSSYVLGETITYSWTSKNATYAGWQQDTSGKDHLLLPGDKLPANGTQAVVASVTGNPSVTLTVGGAGTGSCSLTVAVTSPTPVVTIDKTVPTVPASATVANLAAVSGSGWSVDLSWGASTDNVGVTGYIVKRILPTVAELTTTTGKTFKLTGLTVGGEYTVSIQAKDARGNLGPARVVKFKLNFAGMGMPPTVQIISNTVDTAVQKVVAQTPSATPLTGAEQSTKIETLTSLMNKLMELQGMVASLKASQKK